MHYYKNNAPGEFLIIIGNPITLSGLETVFAKSIPENNVIHTASNENISAYIEEMKNADGKYALTKLCGYFNLLMSAVIPNLQLKPQLQTAHSTLSKILDYCNKSFKDEISLDDVSQKLHLSKYYISHIINKELNLSFSDYINSLRISAACDMLKETDAKIADVSEDIGFGTIRSFNRIFKEHMNITPGEYRRIFKEK